MCDAHDASYEVQRRLRKELEQNLENERNLLEQLNAVRERNDEMRRELERMIVTNTDRNSRICALNKSLEEHGKRIVELQQLTMEWAEAEKRRKKETGDRERELLSRIADLADDREKWKRLANDGLRHEAEANELRDERTQMADAWRLLAWKLGVSRECGLAE